MINIPKSKKISLSDDIIIERIVAINQALKPYLSSIIQAFAYSVIFLLLYLLVLHLFPGDAAISIINSCTSNATARFTNFVIAPFSYFEMLILTSANHITGIGIPILLISNLLFVVVGIFAIVLYYNDFSIRYRHAFGVNKIIFSSILATWALCLTFIPCGTGISIIGVSLNLFAGIGIFKDARFLRSQGKMHGPTLHAYVAAATVTLFIAATYIVSGPIQHVLGIVWFIIILCLIDGNFRKMIRNILRV